MNPHLKNVLNFIRQSKELSDHVRNDLSMALEQADAELKDKNHELDVEASLEKVRAVAIGMRKPGDLLEICKIIYEELQALGFIELRNAMINIHDDAAGSFLNYDYSQPPEQR